VEELDIIVQDSRSSFGTKDEAAGTRHRSVGTRQVGASATGTSTSRRGQDVRAADGEVSPAQFLSWMDRWRLPLADLGVEGPNPMEVVGGVGRLRVT
jgi:hypothetical protein